MINLSKGQKINLSKDTNYALIGLGWDTNRYDGGQDFDLDASVFMLGEGERLLREKDFIFYNNLKAENGCVIHSGDNRVGDADGDDEQIRVDLSKVPADIQKLVVVVTIHEAEARRQSFGQVSNAYVRLSQISSMDDKSEGTTQVRYDLGEDFSVETAVNVAEIYRYNGAWKFAAVGAGFKNGLQGFVDRFYR